MCERELTYEPGTAEAECSPAMRKWIHNLEVTMPENFATALQAYFEGCKAIEAAHHAKWYPNVTPKEWRIDRLQKRVRIVSGDSAHSFVDIATGDVLMCAGWKVPAKHARGNIFDADNGLKLMGPYGPAYLR